MDDPPVSGGASRAARWGLIAGAGMIGGTALALLAVTLTLSNDRCEQATRLLADATVSGEQAPEDLAAALPEEAPSVDAAAEDQALSADDVARAFADPSLGRPLLDEHGFARGLARAWRGPGVLASAWALAFETPNGASAFARELALLTCDAAERVFGISGIPGAVGLRLRFDDGVQDEVAFARGELVLVTGVTRPGDDPSDTRAAERLARAAYDRLAAAAR